MALAITVALNDDGTIDVRGMDSPDVAAWLIRHQKAVGVHVSASPPPDADFYFAPASDAPHIAGGGKMSCPGPIRAADILAMMRAVHAESPPVVWYVPVPKRARTLDKLRRLDGYMTARFGTPGPIDRPIWGNARRQCCGGMLALGT